MVQGTRALNRSAILTGLLRSRPSSRKELAAATGVSQPTVTRAVDVAHSANRPLISVAPFRAMRAGLVQTRLPGTRDKVLDKAVGTTTKRLVAGSVGTVPSGVIHDVVNTDPVVATSLHVYSDPLRTMTYYDRTGEPTYTELVEQVPALLTSATVPPVPIPAAARMLPYSSFPTEPM